MLPVPTAGAKTRKLTRRQSAFVREYVSNGGKKTEAAVAAGYNPASAREQAYEIMRKPQVAQAIMDACLIELTSTAPQALNRLQSLLDARSEYVALEAAKDVLDRLGMRAPDRVDTRIGGEITVNIDLS